MKIILLAIRTLLRFRLYTAINILGLALSLACCILIFRYVYSEMTTDHFIPEVDKVCYTVMEDEVSHQKDSTVCYLNMDIPQAHWKIRL